MAANATSKKQSYQQLQQNSKVLLSEQEQQYLYNALKEYKAYKSVDKLVRSLFTCLNTTGKLKILRDVRNLLAPVHLQKYDTLIHNALASKAVGSSAGQSRPSGPGKYRVVTLLNDKTDLGFSICGGKDMGLGIFVSKVKPNSPASEGGLLAKDQLVEVNGISLQNIPLLSAGNLLVSLNKLKLVVKEENIFNLPQCPEINPWASKTQNNSISMNGSANHEHLKEFTPAETGFSSLQSSLSDKAGSITSYDKDTIANDQQSLDSLSIRKENSLLSRNSEGKERNISLKIESNKDGFIGFNIRGGCEYGLGIYVSSVDVGSIADECGIKIGDQILEANGKNFENILHEDAVEFFKSNSDVILRVKAVGRIPAEKCFIEEYSWLAPDGSVISELRKTDYMSSSMPSPVLREQSRDVRDFGTDAMKFSANETINLPVETLSISTTAEIGTDPIIPDVIENNFKETRKEKEIEVIVTSQEKLNDVDGHRRSPSATSLVSKKSTDSGKSERGTKSVNSEEFSDSDRSRGDGSHLLTTSKAKRSRSFLQKQGDKLKAKFSIRSKKRAAKQNIFDNDPYHQKNKESAREYLHFIEERAKQLLSVNEYKDLMKRIKDYLEKGDIELFSSNILEILDSPGKSLLLKDIRTIIFPHDIGRYDARISRREIDNAITNGGDVATSPVLDDGQISEAPPKRTLVTAVQDKGGKFRLRSKQEADQFEKQKEEHTKKMSKKYAKQRSILERDITIQRYKSLSNVPRPSEEYTQEWDIELDESIRKDLDYIPTKEESQKNIEEMYAKVDKSTRKSLSDVVFTKDSEDTVDGGNGIHRRVGRMMSDIVEDQEYAVPDMSRKSRKDENSNEAVYNAVGHDDNDDDDDDDDYTAIGPIIENTNKRREIRVAVPKQGRTLGISISGGKGSTQQPEVRIERVYPGGAVDEIKVLKAGYQLLSINGHSLADVTHNEAVDLIRRSFSDKSNTMMEVVALSS